VLRCYSAMIKNAIALTHSVLLKLAFDFILLKLKLNDAVVQRKRGFRN